MYRFEASVYAGALPILPAPPVPAWSPLGLRIDGQGWMWLTDVAADHHSVLEIAAAGIDKAPWQDFEPAHRTFGTPGQEPGQLLFPNSVVADSLDRIYVTDGNNGRISVWDSDGEFLYVFGQGAGSGALNLPRGAAIDRRDRLHVVDAVGQQVKVYDVSGAEPEFLYAFGDWGLGDGQFNYPNDIAIESGGRVYVADRESNRVQVWTY